MKTKLFIQFKLRNIILFLLFFNISFSFSQVDTCQIDSTVRNLYFNDAINLTISLVQQNVSHPYHDSIHLPYTQVNRILNDLGMVYYLTGPERDTVVSLYNIHWIWDTFYKRNEIIITPDTNYLWVRQFILDSVTSGNSTFDSLISGNGFKLEFYSQHYNYIEIYTDSIYNITPIINILNTLPGVVYATEGPTPVGDGDNITYNSTPSYEELIYSHGWDDCPSGCIERCYWVFHVFSDCSATFVNRYGNNPVVTNISGIIKQEKIEIFPNPTTTTLTIQTPQKVTIEISNIEGQTIKTFNNSGKETNVDVSGLSGGVYILKVQGDKGVVVRKFIKE